MFDPPTAHKGKLCQLWVIITSLSDRLLTGLDSWATEWAQIKKETKKKMLIQKF